MKRLFCFPLSILLSYAMSIELSRIILKFFLNRGSLCVRGRSHLYIYVLRLRLIDQLVFIDDERV